MHVTVCICTRNRGDSIIGTLRGIVALDYDDFDVVIVDQSSGDDTAHAVEQAIGGDDRFEYVRSCNVGASAARNAAIRQARGPLIAFTDDDCDVPVDWLTRLVSYFRHCPDVGEICGEVRAGPYAPGRGFIPVYEVGKRKRISSPWLKWREGGIGANMAFRLDALRAAGPFDEMLGPGAPLFNCEDGDMTYRLLKRGYTVLNVPDAYVVHNGFRTWEQGQKLMRRTGIAVGAAYTKHLRLGDIAVVPTLLVEWLRCISWHRLLRFQRYNGLARFLAYGIGIVKSFQFDIDRQQRTYRVDTYGDGAQGACMER